MAYFLIKTAKKFFKNFFFLKIHAKIFVVWRKRFLILDTKGWRNCSLKKALVYIGELGGRKGIFPISFVEILQEPGNFYLQNILLFCYFTFSI
jgi:hypothetical protein